MQYNLLGNTSIRVSAIGLGTVKFGRNQGVRYPQSFELPSDQDIQKLFSTANAVGINLIDTAPAYGSSEERIGKLLTNRHDWIISTKVGEYFNEGQSHFDFSKATIRSSIENSLRQLRTDYLDIVLVHSNGEDEKIIIKDDVFSTLADLKKSGLIRAFGMSTKTIAGGLLAVENSDVVMVTYNPLQNNERPVIVSAAQKHKGVFIKKALASGHLSSISENDPVRTSLEFIFAEPGVTSVIIGTKNPIHLQQAAGFARA